MASTSPSGVKLEIGHVLFIDIVGYSKLLITEQSELLRRLSDVVRETEQFRSAEAEGKLVRLPSGDGMAFVFRNSPEATVQCDLELSTGLKAHPELKVRMGIHSGPVNEVADVNERANITGAGINIAQRVMDCGDSGHILLSKHVADDLEQYPQWRSELHDLGECEVKHGVRIHAVNFYTGAVHYEIVTELAKIADLKVISRTSVMQYKSGLARNLRNIGEELGVAHVVEGSVQRAANKIRVNAQLIDARNDAHLWAQTYDRDLADVFAIQSEIAKAIADQLQAKLSPNEKKAIEQPPTTDLAAFDLYSRAKSLLLMAGFSVTYGPDVRKAIELLDEAVKRDPSFFDAYCQLAYAHEYLYGQTGSDHTPARLALAEAAVQAATRLRPDAAETHLARAQYLYYGLRDYAGALAELEIARRGLPNDPRLFELTGYILRRRGQHEEGLRNLQRAVELDPRNFFTLQQIALSYQFLGRYADSVAAMDRALAIVPDSVETQDVRGLFYLFWKADTRTPRQAIDAILAQEPSAIGVAADTWFLCALADRDPAAAERALFAVGDNACWSEGVITLSHSFGEGLPARMTKDEARARTAFEAARVQQEKIVQAQPDYGPALCVLGLIDAALGRKELALNEGRRAIALTPLEKDVVNGSRVLQYFAITAAWAGDKELALQQLEAGLRAPVASLMLSYGALKLLPFWDPLRGDPRFEKIVASLAPKQ